jgi:hypothetical protein
MNKAMSEASIRKISVIGNAGGGKSRLSRKLADHLKLPLTHVDSVQFLADLKIRPFKESVQILREVQNCERWLIDGFGPLDILVERLEKSDRIIFIDLPLWRHYWWITLRQIRSVWWSRPELPAGCREASWSHTQKLFKTLWQVHTKMRPEMRRILSRENLRDKVVIIKKVRDLNPPFCLNFTLPEGVKISDLGDHAL